MIDGINRTILLLPLMAPILFSGCVSQSGYDALQSEYDALKAQNLNLQQQIARDNAQIRRLQGVINYTVNSDLLFPAAGWQMYAQGEQVIAKIASQLAPTQQNKLLVSAYTDNAPIGPGLKRTGITSNLDLSQKQAESVAQFLISQGVKPDLVSVQGFGDANPAASNDTATGRTQNRRVEIALETEEGVGPPPAPAILPSRFSRALHNTRHANLLHTE
jgi:chemotaxis protein MotB